MNRYPLWKYVLIFIVLLFSIVYTIPNFFGESPALQISSSSHILKIRKSLIREVSKILYQENLKVYDIRLANVGKQDVVRLCFHDTDTQFKAKALLEKNINFDSDYVISFNLVPNLPRWLQILHASPMHLGLDLRGGVHFLMQIDTKFIISKHLENLRTTTTEILDKEKIHYTNISCSNESININFYGQGILDRAQSLLKLQLPEAIIYSTPPTKENNSRLTILFKPKVIREILNKSITQNVVTLSKRVNELGVTEPIIQRQGSNQIMIQLPGVQDVSRAKDIIGRSINLEIRMVEDLLPIRGTRETVTKVPFDCESFRFGNNLIFLHKESVLTGDYITSADVVFDENQQPIVSIDLSNEGGRKMRKATRSRIGKYMGIVLFEKGKGEVVTVANIQGELGSHFQISGINSLEAVGDLALLLRSGSMAAPMKIIEECTIGPQLGIENIKKGFNATVYGFLLIAAFIIMYYALFGVFSVSALSLNLLLLIALLSTLKATLTLPGIAAIALTLGVSIDSNILINERIREELRKGISPQKAISVGFERAWTTILDSNITTLISGLALLIFGSGAIRGFAIVHCLGILTSIFSSVFVFRGLTNLWYGRKRKLTSLAIGYIWK